MWTLGREAWPPRTNHSHEAGAHLLGHVRVPGVGLGVAAEGGQWSVGGQGWQSQVYHPPPAINPIARRVRACRLTPHTPHPSTTRRAGAPPPHSLTKHTQIYDRHAAIHPVYPLSRTPSILSPPPLHGEAGAPLRMRAWLAYQHCSFTVRYRQPPPLPACIRGHGCVWLLCGNGTRTAPPQLGCLTHLPPAGLPSFTKM